MSALLNANAQRTRLGTGNFMKHLTCVKYIEILVKSQEIVEA